jgi:L-ribulose-5-phosphate 3-epimerase
MKSIRRRVFVKQAASLLAGASISTHLMAGARRSAEPLFKISLAQWSLHRLLFSGNMDHLDFARLSRENGIEAIEYVNQFFMDKATDEDYLREMKIRAEGEGVRSLLIMCDREGRIGDPDAEKRQESVDRHKKWVEAAKFLGCHSIRINGYSEGSFTEQMKLVADGLRSLCEFSDPYDIDVIIENHGGYSSNGQWLVGVMKQADHPRAGTLPDFGNFRIGREEGKNISYDSYRGVAELMPYARGVSVKTTAWDDEGNESELDYLRMMRIVLDAGYRGYCGIEHSDPGREWEGIREVKERLEATQEALAEVYGE